MFDVFEHCIWTVLYVNVFEHYLNTAPHCTFDVFHQRFTVFTYFKTALCSSLQSGIMCKVCKMLFSGKFISVQNGILCKVFFSAKWNSVQSTKYAMFTSVQSLIQCKMEFSAKWVQSAFQWSATNGDRVVELRRASLSTLSILQGHPERMRKVNCLWNLNFHKKTVFSTSAKAPTMCLSSQGEKSVILTYLSPFTLLILSFTNWNTNFGSFLRVSKSVVGLKQPITARKHIKGASF